MNIVILVDQEISAIQLIFKKILTSSYLVHEIEIDYLVFLQSSAKNRNRILEKAYPKFKERSLVLIKVLNFIKKDQNIDSFGDIDANMGRFFSELGVFFSVKTIYRIQKVTEFSAVFSQSSLIQSSFGGVVKNFWVRTEACKTLRKLAEQSEVQCSASYMNIAPPKEIALLTKSLLLDAGVSADFRVYFEEDNYMSNKNNILATKIARCMELLSVLMIFFLSFWLLIIIAALVRTTSKGPVIFKQFRVGENGQLFELYKFRTMYVGSAEVATHEADRNSITKIGYFLRTCKLDELPQLYNIWRGELTFVGPRPCLPSQLDLVNERLKRGLLDLKPGVTGLAQINGVDMSDLGRLLSYDDLYFRMKSRTFDLLILVATLVGKGQQDNVKNEKI